MNLLVVTPTLGTSPFLQETATSIRDSTNGCDWEYVIAAPARVLGSLSSVLDCARIVPDTGSGLYAALNAGIAAAAHAWDWFSYLNDDDRWHAPGMHTALLHADTVGDSDVIYGRVRLIREDGTPAGELPVARDPRDVRVLLSRGIIPFAQPGMLVRRTTMEKLRGFDATYRSAGDLDLTVRALLHGARFCFVDHVVAEFRLRRNQLSKDAPVVAAETARALAALRDDSAPTLGALLRFRLANLGAYAGRLRHHGPIRMSDVYRKA